MKVLHAPVEVAGQLALSVAALRSVGVEATAYCAPHRFGYEHGPDVSPAVGAPARYVRETARLVAAHDVVHFHFATSFLNERRRFVDARLIRALGKSVLVTFHGSEIRRPSVESARNPHYVPFEGEDDAIAERRLRAWAGLTGGHVVLLDPALVAHVQPYFTHVHQHRLTVDASRYPAAPARDGDPPRIVHAPTERAGKGTDLVRAAVAALQADGVAFEYDEVFGVPHRELLARYGAADLVVDQLRQGNVTVSALDAMAMGRPVIAYLHPSVRDAQPRDLPVVHTEPEALAATLAALLADPARRRAIGAASRAYVEREHDLVPSGRRLAELYAT